MAVKYIAIAGNMGTGKSSLVGFLCRHFGLKPFFEPNETNPYLADFYKDMKAYAFHSQIYFLARKFKMVHALALEKETVVQDRTIFEDAEIFAALLHRQGYISERDFKIYKDLYQSILLSIRPPDLLIYLRCSPATIKKRVAKRGRGMEQKVPEDYLLKLNRLYDRWIQRYKLSEMLVYPTDKLDYLSDFIHQDELLRKIGKYL